MRAWIHVAPLTFCFAMRIAEARPDVASSISVRASNHCQAAAAGLAERVSRALVGEPAAGVRALVTIEAASTGYQVTLRTMRGSVELGEKTFDVPTCDEAVDAAVVVLALALSEVHAAERANPEPALARAADFSNETGTPASTVPPDERTRVGRRVLPIADHGAISPKRENERRSRLRASLFTGVDTGTLPVPTAQVGAGVAKAFEHVELRATGRYGLPYEEEETDTGRSELTRYQFGALDLDACYALGTRFRLAGCAGGEISVVMSERRLQTEAGLEVNRGSRPRLSGLLTALFAHRGGSIQPELELSSAVVAVGGDDTAPNVTFRATAGVAVEF